MNTNEMEWIHSMQKKDTLAPEERNVGEMIYTLTLADFRKMPDVNFFDIATMDAHVRSLFN